VCQFDDPFDWIYRPERVGNVRYGNYSGPFVEQANILFNDQLAIVIHRDDVELCTHLLSEQLPWNYV
jgi:hypothetical protein